MFKVRIYPSKCPRREFMFFAGYEDGKEAHLSDGRLRNHEMHGCIEVLEHYRREAITPETCPTCGHVKKGWRIVQLPILKEVRSEEETA